MWATVLPLTNLPKAGTVNSYGVIPGFQQVLQRKRMNVAALPTHLPCQVPPGKDV